MRRISLIQLITIIISSFCRLEELQQEQIAKRIMELDEQEARNRKLALQRLDEDNKMLVCYDFICIAFILYTFSLCFTGLLVH